MKTRQKYLIAYLFVIPYLLVFITFIVLPVGISMFYSLTDFNMLQAPNFIGLANYKQLFFGDDIFIKAISNTLLLAVITGPISYILCLLFAWFINELSPKLRAFITLIFYAPAISGNAYLIWQLIFSGDRYGFVNSFLMNFNITSAPVLWLQDVSYIRGIIILVAIWSSLGTSFLAFIAGFQGIDKTYYEAAAMDGVNNRWQEMWFVTLPLMKPQLMFGAVMSITASFGIGSIITAMVGFPSPDYIVHTIQNHLEDFGGIRYEFGYACAIATILFAIMVLTNFFIKKVLSKVGT